MLGTGTFSHPIPAPQCPHILVLGHSQALPVLSNAALPWRRALERKSGVCWEAGGTDAVFPYMSAPLLPEGGWGWAGIWTNLECLLRK